MCTLMLYCANTYIPLLAGPLREQLPTQENSWTHVHALCTLAHALPPHSQPLRKPHLKEATDSGGCLPAASASSPSSSPGAPISSLRSRGSHGLAHLSCLLGHPPLPMAAMLVCFPLWSRDCCPEPAVLQGL